ncbi:MAG TPA: PxKF domain-containing protein [Anaerolineales bacterium]|nr:PxKF domain-containing protein [Anaerolineales bacterium]
MAKNVVRSFSIVIILSILLAQFGLRHAAADANFVVNSTVDMVDANPGDGLCETDITGDCTLRAAVQEANAFAGADTITLPAGSYVLSQPGTGEDEAASGDLDIAEEVTITGAGMGATIIDASNLDRAFQIFAALDLSDLTIQNGSASPGGALLVNGVARVTHVELRNNQANAETSSGTGGAIYLSVEASAEITQSQFSSNYAYFGGGAVASANATTFTVTDSTFDSNTTTLGGGALYPNGFSAIITNSTFVNNSADTGGAIHSNANSVEVTNSTFVGNSAVNHGAIDSRMGTITVNNSTFSGNTASSFGDTLGDQPEQGGDVQVQNSILSGASIDNCGGSVVDLGNNLSWPIENNCPGTQDDPRLDSLADNGGPTQTVALLTGSPAIDSGNNDTCESTDQRGVTRPQGEACDIGAFESALINIFSVTNTNDSGAGSLRQAILSANSTPNSLNGPDEIHFNIPSEGASTISPVSELPAITEPVIIDGYTQPDASPNTLATGDNADIRVELNGDACDGACAQGLLISSGGSTIRGLAIHGNFNNGIEVNETGSTVAGNFFGLRADGTANGVIASGVYINNSSNNVVGGNAPADRNVISNNRDGVFIAAGVSDATNNIVTNNYLGTNPAGTLAQGNTQRGVFVGGFGRTASDNSISGNLISGNGHFGILLRDGSVTDTLIASNRIGVTANGTSALPNGEGTAPEDGLAGTNAHAGVYIAGPGNTIGGLTAGAGNTIAFNADAGIVVASGAGNTILHNIIFSNSSLSIDLGGDGVTFNHAGLIAGPNNYQNYPVLSLATSDGATTRVAGSLESDAGQNFTIDVFANDACDPSFFGEGKTYLGSFTVTTNASGVAIFDRELAAGVTEPHGVSATATGNNGTSEFSYCRPSATPNLNWVQAQTVSDGSQTQQFITDIFQEKWFKFAVQPGSTVHVKLTSLPGSAVSLHRDPYPIYNSLIDPENAALLSAEASDAAFLPSGSLPSGSLPSGSLPSGSLPSGSLPSGSLPTGYLPSGSLPSGSLPSGSLPSGSLPSGSLPSGSLPSGSLPSGSLPSGSLPSGSLPSGSLPSGSLPSGSLPSGSLPSGSLPSGSLDAYASAARQSLLGISMDPYATVQTMERNTYDLQEDLYVRIVGPYNLETPFTLEIEVDGGVCGDVQPVPDSLPVISGPAPSSGSFQSLILTDSSRLDGTSSEVADVLADLETLSGRSDVNGLVLDLSDSKYARVAFANNEADQNLACAAAKNTVAKEIKNVIDAYRAVNSNLEYIVLAGGADVIPFFQVQDVSGLANEKDYVVPVAPSTASEAGLKTNLVQEQDAYGSQVDITLAGHTLALPDLAVGRLVDTASDISAAVSAYIQTDGVIVPNSSLVTGYDFVGDAAVAIKAELDAGTNSTADTLIQPPGEPPTGPNAWTADQLRTKLLGGNFDIAMLSGHFSAGNLLAADYATQLSAAEIAQSSADLTDVLILALGCHSGYTIPNGDLLTGVSPDPDWAKAFLRKGAAGYISATGYAYGDTEFVEYGERLFLRMAQQLRTGSGPISVGQAVVKAKQQFLAETAQLTGIDQKTLVEMTLYGLPMMKVDMPGARLNPPTETSIVGSTDPATTGPGADFGLRSSVVVLNPVVTLHTKTLENLSGGGTVTTTYLSGADGVVANPFEPIYPKEIFNVTSNGNVLRGVALRGGTYNDLAGIVPLTSSPTTETSTAHLSFNTDVFYPTQTWAPNFSEAVAGGKTSLIVFPAQFQSSAPAAIDGILRKFDQLDLKLYYLSANWTNAGSAETKAAAVSAGPTILGASGVEDGNAIHFTVNAATDGSAGIQTVWILYTGKPGSGYYGTWAPLDLVQNVNDPTLWEGTLSLPSGENAGNILFMVQAVGGAGLTTLATNLGAYYSITDENAPQLPPPAETTLTLQSPPSSGTYLKDSTFNLLLESGSQPLAGQLVTIDIGGQQASGVTDSSGEVSLILNLVVRPGDYTAQASFRGNTDYRGSNDTSDFTVRKDSTTLTVTPSSANVLAGQLTPFVAVVHDSSGRALGGRSVFFIVHNNTDSFATSVIADFAGNAPLGMVPLPPGTYTVDAYFNGTIPVNPSITLSDDYYESSSRLGLSLTISGDATLPIITATATKADNTPYTADTWTNQTVTVHFTCTDTGSGIASCPADQVFSTDGTFNATGTAIDNNNNSATVGFGPIKIDKTAPTLSPSVSPNPVFLNGTATASPGATDAGSGIATQSCGTVLTNSVGTKTVTCTATDNAGNTGTATATYHVIFHFTGFFNPVKNPPIMNEMNAGRSVPLKFSLNGNQGLAVFAAGSPSSLQIQCNTLNPVDNVEETTLGSNSFSYDPATNTYTYIWKTEKSWAGTCRQVSVRFIDGQTYLLNFAFR